MENVLNGSVNSPQASIVFQDIVTVEIIPGAKVISKESSNLWLVRKEKVSRIVGRRTVQVRKDSHTDLVLTE
jgi:hypothetical protein